jgi:hypothetical protein
VARTKGTHPVPGDNVFIKKIFWSSIVKNVCELEGNESRVCRALKELGSQ